MAGSTIKFAVCGFGNIGKRHATIINSFPGAELVALIDTNPAAFNDVLFPTGTPIFTSLLDFLKSNIKADVVNIATPNGLHCSQALLALEHSCHVVIEKPMGIDKADCEQVIQKAGEADKQVFVVMQNRYSPPGQWMKKIVSDGLIGDVFTVQVNCYWNRDERYYKKNGWRGTMMLDGGTLFTQFSHFIDILYWVFGDIKDINAIFKNFNHVDMTKFEDSGVVNFEFEKGGIGSINFSTSVWDKNMESSITVVGSKGSFKVGGQYMNTVEYCHIENYTMPAL
ncbi:MAG TPA: Gfo/Idh/MocA family oxidoreductase, partial [Bacteroidia bacterium]|nr:Gfo/Idh/MocA family oxidoreductase [Bacteroidia bacterium]